MIKIKTTKHFDTVLRKQADVACFLFMSNKHQQDRSLSTTLTDECDEEGMELYNIEVNNKELSSLVYKYGTGLLPKYVFIKGGVVVHTAYGLTPKETIKQEIKRAGDSE